MLVIGKQQMQAFQRQSLRRFATEMMAHAQAFAPTLSQVLGEAQLALAIDAAIIRADKYGFSNRGSLRLFVEMCFLFGSAFDSDPQYPWAAEILAQPVDQMARAERLYQQILDYQAKVSGPDGVNTNHALRNIAFLRQQLPAYSAENFVAGMLQTLGQLFPQKAIYLGNHALHGLVQRGCAEAQQAHFQSARAYTMMIVLMFTFGHGCVTDPLYPWIANTLSDEKIADPIARAERLERKAMTWLEHALANLSVGQSV